MAGILLGALTASAGDFQENDALAAAVNEVTYFDFSRGYKFFSKALAGAKEGSVEWQQAIFGKAVCAQQRTPSGPDLINEAVRLYDKLIRTTPDSRYAARAMMNLGRVCELVDFYQDPVDLDKARSWYRRVLATWPEQAVAGEATLRLAGAYIQTYDEAQVRQGIEILEDWLVRHPEEPLASLMWHYLGDTYYLPFKDYAKALTCYLEADRLGTVEKGREGLLYWRIAILADRWVKNRDVAIRYYTRIIEKTPTSGKAYESQVALQRLGAPVPEITLFKPAVAAAGKERAP